MSGGVTFARHSFQRTCRVNSIAVHRGISDDGNQDPLPPFTTKQNPLNDAMLQVLLRETARQ